VCVQLFETKVNHHTFFNVNLASIIKTKISVVYNSVDVARCVVVAYSSPCLPGSHFMFCSPTQKKKSCGVPRISPVMSRVCPLSPCPQQQQQQQHGTIAGKTGKLVGLLPQPLRFLFLCDRVLAIDEEYGLIAQGSFATTFSPSINKTFEGIPSALPSSWADRNVCFLHSSSGCQGVATAATLLFVATTSHHQGNQMTQTSSMSPRAAGRYLSALMGVLPPPGRGRWATN
jgi:hypothetical protein